MSDLTSLVVQRWRHAGVTPPPPCSDEELDLFERRESVRLPEAFRRYLKVANGMPAGLSGYQDEQGFSFWSLQRLQRCDLELQRRSPTSARPVDAADYYVFADYLDWSWAYAIKLRGAPSTLGAVVLVGAEKVSQVAPTFEAFLEAYLADSPRLSPMDTPTSG